MYKILVISVVILSIFNLGCKNTIVPDSSPYFTSGEPTAQVTTTKIGNSHIVKGTAKDPDGDDIYYKTLKNGTQVNNSNEYTFTIDKKGMTRIDVVAYNALSDTLTKYFSADNQKPTANDKTITMDEKSTETIPQTSLGTDTDGDELNYNITSTSNGVNAEFKNEALEITGQQDYFGNANINYRVSDGEATANGTININFTPINDKPIANAGNDQTGTIKEEITLDGSQSHDPDQTTIKYEWKNLNNTENTSITNNDQANATFKANTKGSYEVELTVTDPTGLTNKDTTKVTINSSTITGRILDTDTQNTNNTLLAWVTTQGTTDTTWTNNGEYPTRNKPKQQPRTKSRLSNSR